jgi:hypothetical protein
VNSHRYANVANPQVNALITQRFRFAEADDAVKKLRYFEKNFTISNKEKAFKMPAGKIFLMLWIKDYHLTQEEIDEGYLGNFAFVTPRMLPTGLYTLHVEKIAMDIKFHPRRRRKLERLPNWGHPVLRNVKKQKIYATLEDVTQQFEQLMLEYPDTTIPADNKLLLLIFDRETNPKHPAQKYVLRIKAHKEGGFYLEASLNEHVGRMGPKANAKADNADASPSGYFTSMVSLKRKNRPANSTEES